MINAYLNQTATLKTAGILNDYGEVTYTETTIKCRFEYNRKIVRDKTGVEVVSEAYIWTKVVISDNDILVYGGKNWPIISINECVGIDGVFSHYEVRL